MEARLKGEARSHRAGITDALAAAGVPATPATLTALGRQLDEVARAHPELGLDDASVAAALLRAAARARRDEAQDVALLITELRAVDVAFAAACGAGHPRALALFEERFVGELRLATRRIVRDPHLRDEVLQQLREKLFVGAGGAGPKILDFSGRGDLRNWLRAIAARHALNFVSRGKREDPLEDRLLDALEAPGADPELLHARALYRAELRAAFAEAALALSPRERNVLRFACLEGMSIDAIGSALGAHRATAARWVAAARERLLAGVRRSLSARLRVPPRELDSILRVVHGGVSITLDRYLGGEAPPGA